MVSKDPSWLNYAHLPPAACDHPGREITIRINLRAAGVMAEIGQRPQGGVSLPSSSKYKDHPRSFALSFMLFRGPPAGAARSNNIGVVAHRKSRCRDRS